MKLPLLLSVPHAGIKVPPEVGDLCILSRRDIADDSDGGASEIYYPLRPNVLRFVTTTVARAVIDMNRAETDRSRDGVVKTHTCLDVPVYRRYPSNRLVEKLIHGYYKPYHTSLDVYGREAVYGIDCHTMAEVGPPVGPDPGRQRPCICLSNAGFTCPRHELESLATCLQAAFGRTVLLNHPFKGGYIIRSSSHAIPWIQIEISRNTFFSNAEKSERLREALERWCRKHLRIV